MDLSHIFSVLVGATASVGMMGGVREGLDKPDGSGRRGITLIIWGFNLTEA